MKKNQAMQRQLVGLLGQEVVDFPADPVESQSHPSIPFRLPVIEENQVNCEICHRKLSSHYRLKKYIARTPAIIVSIVKRSWCLGQPHNPLKLPVPPNQEMWTTELLVEFARKSTTVIRS